MEFATSINKGLKKLSYLYTVTTIIKSKNKITTSGNNKFRKNLIFNFIFTILSTLSTFILMKYTFTYFNKDQENYGLWLMIFSFLSYIYIMDFGLSNGLRNLVTPNIGKDDKKVNNYISNNFSFIFIISIFLLIITNIILYSLPLNFMNNINGFKVNLKTFKNFITILINLQILYFFFSGIKPIFHSYSMSYLINISQFFGNVLTIFLIYISIITNTNNNWILLAWIFIGSQIIVIVSISLIVILKKDIKISWQFDKKVLSELINIGFKFFFLQISNLILFNSLPILIGVSLSLIDASRFQLSYKLLSIYIMVFSIIMSPTWTLVLEKSNQKDFAGIKNIFDKLLKITIFFSVLIIMSSFLLNSIVFIWMGENFNISFFFSILMAIYIILNIICAVMQGLMNGLNLFKSQIAGYLIGAIFLLLLTLIFKVFAIINIELILILGIISLMIPCLFMIITFNKFIKRSA